MVVDEALVLNDVAADGNVAQDGVHALDGLDALVNPDLIAAEQAQQVVHGVAVDELTRGKIGDDHIGDLHAAFGDHAGVAVAGGRDLEQAQLLVDAAKLADGLEVSLRELQHGAARDLGVRAVGEIEVVQRVDVDLGIGAGLDDVCARLVFRGLDAQHLVGREGVAVDDQGGRLAPQGAQRHLVDALVVIGGAELGEVAVHIARGGDFQRLDHGDAEHGVAAVGSGLAAIGRDVGHGAVKLADEIGHLIRAHPGQILHLHHVEQARDRRAVAMDPAVGLPRLHQRAADGDAVAQLAVNLLAGEIDGAMLQQVVAALAHHVIDLGGAGLGGENLPLLLGKQVSDLLNFGVDVRDLVHLRLVFRLVIGFQRRLRGVQGSLAVGRQRDEFSFHGFTSVKKIIISAAVPSDILNT